ncbi:MAG: cell division protein FtsX [Parvularculaceae bacterium]
MSAAKTKDAGPAAPPRRRPSPLLPEAGAAGGSLTAVLAVIAALAALALAALVAINVAANAWTEELAASMTVQVKGVDRAEIAARADAAVAALETAPGVVDVRLRSPREAAQLLEPWLGENADRYLNVPAIIEVKVEPAVRDDLEALRARLAAAAPGVVLDDHGDWNLILASAARGGQLAAFGVFTLILAAACAVAAFAARAGLAANADIVSLLHLIGATDDFIAAEVQRRFLAIGLKGALAGLVVAARVAFFAIAVAGARGGANVFAPGLALHPGLLLPAIAVPLAICLASAASARIAVLRSLRREY